MHYFILFQCGIETEADVTFFVDNLLGVCFDVSVLYLAFYFLLRKRNKAAASTCFVITWLWSLTNIIYSRFFFHYLTLSAIGQGGVLTDDVIIKCVVESLRPSDLYFLLSAFLFVILLRMKSVTVPLRVPRKVLMTLCILIVVDIFTHTTYCALSPQLRHVEYFFHRLHVQHFDTHRNLSQPNFANFVRGGLRTIGAEILNDLQGTMELQDSQLAAIKAVISENQICTSDTTNTFSSKNVIFILVESYMSFTSDMKTDGREVTPFLNSLKRDSTVYYNGLMNENVTIGESSDGQFIYMAGLLPLRSAITVSKARHATLHGLPKMFGRESRMVIPTVTSMWNQDEMCRQYGFDRLYASNDYSTGSNKNLNDEQVFQLAMQKDANAHQPFFSVILTMSMHQPYTEQIDPTFPITDTSITNELACYLNVCHYTDRQIEGYFESLKRNGLYDNSLIVIAADHPVHNTDFGGVSKHIPLYLVNIPGEVRSKMWQGECNQIDVYTTLLDLLGVESRWYGLGQSLLSPNYDSTIDARKWDVSEWIIRGDYFANEP